MVHRELEGENKYELEEAGIKAKLTDYVSKKKLKKHFKI